MDFRYSTASHARFGGIMLQVDPAHSVGCGGAQGASAPGEVLKMYDFFDWLALFLRKCSGFDLVPRKSCSRTLDHLSKIKLRCANSKFNLGTPKNQLQSVKSWYFIKIPTFRM